MAVQYELQQPAPDVTVAALTGQLNMGSRLKEFEHEIKQRIEAGIRKMVFDLRGLTFIDSAGVGLVASCASAISKAGGKLVIVSAGGKVKQIFAMTRLDKLIGVYPDMETAFTALSPDSPTATHKAL
jgi:anti-anti-sigma factor